MRKFALFVLASFALAGGILAADDLQLRLTLPRSKMLPFEPFWFTATFTNSTDHPITLSFPSWQFPRLVVVLPDGTKNIGGMDTDSFWQWPPVPPGENHLRAPVPPSGSYVVQQRFPEWCCRFKEPGVYHVYLTYESSGRVLSRTQPAGREPDVICADCWGGELTSNVETITVEVPAGEDAKAYEKYFPPIPTARDKDGNPTRTERTFPHKGLYSPLVSDFPTSVYAAWIRLRHMNDLTAGFLSPWEPRASLEPYLNAARKRYLTDGDPSKSVTENQLPALINEAREILKYHSDVEPLASAARVDLAVLLFVSGDAPSAKEQLDIVAKAHPDREEGRAATRMLNAIATVPNTPANAAPSSKTPKA
jgi:hypothetical protein